jgi:hypothetical protein
LRCALLLVVCRLLIVVCCPLFIVGCMLLVSCCWLLLAAHLDFKTTELYCESTHGCLTMAQIIPRKIMANKTQSRTRNPCPSISIPHVVVTLHMLSLGLLDQYSFSHDVFVLVVCFCPAHGYLHIRHGFFNSSGGHIPSLTILLAHPSWLRSTVPTHHVPCPAVAQP